jgi:hypothetical protein
MNHKNEPDISLFDFTSKFYCEKSLKIFETSSGNRLFCGFVGDSLLAPFWPLVNPNITTGNRNEQGNIISARSNVVNI